MNITVWTNCQVCGYARRDGSKPCWICARRKRPNKYPRFNPTIPARQVYAYVYGQELDRTWRVSWRTFRRRWGDCHYSNRRIRLNYRAFAGGWGSKATGVWVRKPVLRTLIHEFTHLRHPGLRHGAQFERLIERAYGRLFGNNSLANPVD